MTWGDWCSRPRYWNWGGDSQVLVDPDAVWSDTLTAESMDSDNVALKPNNAGRRRVQALSEDEELMQNEAAMDSLVAKLEGEKSSDILPPTYFNITTTNQSLSMMRQ